MVRAGMALASASRVRMRWRSGSVRRNDSRTALVPSGEPFSAMTMADLDQRAAIWVMVARDLGSLSAMLRAAPMRTQEEVSIYRIGRGGCLGRKKPILNLTHRSLCRS